MAQRIDGTAEAAKVRETVRVEAAAFTDRHDLAPGLAVVLVGDSAASQIYVKSKTRHAVEAGLRSFEHRLAEDVDEATLLELVATLNGDDAVHGILVQLPLPPQISTDRVLRAISPAKDVDGFHPENVGLLAQGQPFMVPCTPLGCLHLARTVHRELRGKEVVVVGRSTIVGRPAAQLFLQADCTVTIAHSRTADLPAVCRRADILVVAVGRPEFVRADWVKPGATVIDVGINRLPAEDGGRGRIVGDVDHAGVQSVAGAITPVPGGVGPMTVALLLANTLTCARGLTENSAGRPQR